MMKASSHKKKKDSKRGNSTMMLAEMELSRMVLDPAQAQTEGLHSGNGKRDPFRNIKKVYSIQSHFYDVVFGKVFNEGRKTALHWIHEAGYSAPDLLEVGCGTGLSLKHYPRGFKVTAFDFSPGMVKKAQRKKDKHDLVHVEVMQMDAMDMRFPERSFDIAVLAYVISTVPDPVRVLGEVKRVLRPGGRIYMINHFHQNHSKIIGGLERALAPVFVKLGWTTDLKLEPLLHKAGLAASRVKRVNAFGYWQLVECVNP